jgi:hypothetical protein
MSLPLNIHGLWRLVDWKQGEGRKCPTRSNATISTQSPSFCISYVYNYGFWGYVARESQAGTLLEAKPAVLWIGGSGSESN